jgi:hypothetical protein
MVTPSLAHSKTNDGVASITLAKQWRYVYEAGKTQNPPVAASTAAAFIYLAYSARLSAPKSSIALYYGTAAVLTLGIVPFTLALMAPTNNKLIRYSDRSGGETLMQAQNADFDQLLGRWTTLNALRSLLPLAGGLIGLLACVP